MNLLTQVIVAAIIIALIFVVVYFAAQKINLGQHVTESQAVALVVHDMQNAQPNTVVNVTNVTPSVYPGSWHILLSATFNATSPCPSYASYSFDYPQYGFVYRVENNYTSDCVVYGLEQNRSYIIASAPVAIARSYSLGIPSITSFVKKYGYNNISVHATFYNSVILSFSTYNNTWIVNYSTPNANYSEFAAITQVGGKLITNYSISR